MIDLRLYRLAFLPTLLALVAVMFSLSGAPAAIEPATPPATFEGDRAATLARQIATEAPVRTPGSEGDGRIADLVAERFAEIPAGAVSEQGFEAEFEDEQVSLRNVLLTLPGDGASTVVVLADRDSATGPGATSSAAATGVLIELANALGVTGHEKTYVLASVSGSGAGAAGARRLLEDLPERETVDAVVAIGAPGAAEPHGPYAVASSSAATSGPVQLVRTAELAVETQTALTAPAPSTFTQLARLAIPSGIGPQAPLVADGVDAVTISATGERPAPESEDLPENLSGETVDGFGRATQSTVEAVDATAAPLAHGPEAHLELSDNLIPGWTLALLALALILPAAVAAVDAGARSVRTRLGLGAGVAWAAARALPFLGALLALYALALFGVVPRPAFPFDPGLHEPGTSGAIALALIVLAAIATIVFGRRVRVAAGVAPAAAAAGAGVIAVAACLVLWFVNPYLALLLAPVAHIWILAANGPGGPGRGLVAALAALLASIPALAALAAVAAALDLGAEAPWTFAIMVADGQIGLLTALAACLLAGTLAGTIALCATRSRPGPRGAPPGQAPGEHPTARTSV